MQQSTLECTSRRKSRICVHLQVHWRQGWLGTGWADGCQWVQCNRSAAPQKLLPQLHRNMNSWWQCCKRKRFTITICPAVLHQDGITASCGLSCIGVENIGSQNAHLFLLQYVKARSKASTCSQSSCRGAQALKRQVGARYWCSDARSKVSWQHVRSSGTHLGRWGLVKVGWRMEVG